MDFDNIIYEIFNNKPLDKNQINLNFDGIQSSKDLFECLLMFLTKGLQSLFCNDNGTVDLNSLDDNDFILINKYFQSFGFYFFYDKNIIIDNKQLQSLVKNYNHININSHLKSFKLSFYSKPYLYNFYFDFC